MNPAKPVSPRRLAANRANARKSTGPRTPRGKAVSSRNARKPGLLARNVVIADDLDEAESDFDALLRGLTARLAPDGPFETLLVERIALCYWRLARAARFECRAVADARQDELAPLSELQRQFTGRPADPDRHIIPARASLDALLRYESLVDRQLHRALAHFHRLRTARDVTPPAPPPESGLAPASRRREHPDSADASEEKTNETKPPNPRFHPRQRGFCSSTGQNQTQSKPRGEPAQ